MLISGMTKGTRVRITRDIEMFPTGIFPTGLTGTVSDVSDPDLFGDIMVDVKLDQHFPSLDTWGNTIQIYHGVIQEWSSENFEYLT